MKTIQEAIIEYTNNTDIDEETYIGDVYNGFMAGVKFAQRWIPIEEELPEKLVQVIVKFEDGWCTCTWITEDGDFAFNVKPTHWRPIELK